MLSLLLICVIIIVVAAVAIKLIDVINIDDKLAGLARWLIILFTVLGVVYQLYTHRGVFHL